MKTLKELNSKWYWRFIKVCWFILNIAIFLGIFISSYIYMGQYSPRKIEAAKLEIENNGVMGVINRMKEKFPENTIEIKRLPEIVKPEFKITEEKVVAELLVMSELAQKKINGIRICSWNSLGCNPDGINSVNNYIENSIYNPDSTNIITISNTLYVEAKASITRRYELSKKAQRDIQKIQNKETDWVSFYEFDRVTGLEITDILGEKYYLGVKEFLMLVLISVTSIAGLFSFSILIKRILNYIIFGKFSSK